MTYNFKKKLMTSQINKRNKKAVFDYKAAEEFSLSPSESPIINNSYYFSAHNEEISIFLRVGNRTSEIETWFVIYYKGQIYSLNRELYPVDDNPIKINLLDLGDYSISFKGILNDKDKVDFSSTFKHTQKVINFSTDMPASRMAVAMANEKWNKKFFKGLENISGQTHYEQEGILEGSFTLNGDKVEFSMPCVRDHSFGKRDWNYMNNHLWLMAVSPKGQFNYSLVSYPVFSSLEVGNYRQDNETHFMLSSNLNYEDINKGEIPHSLSFEIELDNKEVKKVEVKYLTGVSYRFSNNQYTLHENIAEFDIGGEKYRGILEIGFNVDKSRYFNGRNIKEINRK